MSNIKERDSELLLPGQAEALRLYASNHGVAEIAERVGVSRSTLWLWLSSDENFRVRLSQEQQARIESGTSRLVELYEDSVNLLGKALSGDTVKGTQLQAAQTILKRLPDLIEMSILHARLTSLEERLGVPQD